MDIFPTTWSIITSSLSSDKSTTPWGDDPRQACIKKHLGLPTNQTQNPVDSNSKIFLSFHCKQNFERSWILTCKILQFIIFEIGHDVIEWNSFAVVRTNAILKQLWYTLTTLLTCKNKIRKCNCSTLLMISFIRVFGFLRDIPVFKSIFM